jgi:hypothetical protein
MRASKNGHLKASMLEEGFHWRSPPLENTEDPSKLEDAD